MNTNPGTHVPRGYPTEETRVRHPILLIFVAMVLALAALLIAACGTSKPHPTIPPPNVSQIATAHGWSQPNPQSVPTYPAHKEILFQDALGYTVDFATFTSNAKRDKWLANARAGAAGMVAAGLPASALASISYYQGPDWAAVDEGTIGNIASSMGG